MQNLYYLLNGLSHHPNAALAASAHKVLAVFDKYGVSITGESYAVESSLVNALLQDLGAPGLSDDIAALPGCAESISAVQTTQQAFEMARIAYEAEKAEKGTELNASKVKMEVVETVNSKIVVYLRAMLGVNEAVYGAFARTIAEIITDNNAVVKKRRKK